MAEPTTEVESPTVLTSRKASPEEPYRHGEADTVEWIEGLQEESRDAKKSMCDPDSWDDDLSTYWGDQWPSNMPSYKPRIVVNEIQSLMLQELSDLTDSRLKVFVQKDRKTMEQDEAVERSIQTFWTRKFCDLTIMSAALDGMIFPLGFLQTGWDPMAEQGQGEVVFRHRDPRSVFPDGDAEDDETLRYFVLRDVLDLIQIRRDFPETGWLVQPEANFSEAWDDRKEKRGPTGGQGYTGPLYSHTPLGRIRGWKKARARVLTAVIDDDDIEEELIEIQDAAGGMRLQGVVRPKYPNRRMIIIANRRVLYDEDCPYHHAPILTSMTLQPRVHGYWPQASIVRAYAEIQATANKHDSMVAENGLRLNLGKTYADADSGIDPQNYGDLPGAVYLIRPNSRLPKTEYPNPMPNDMITAGERLRSYIRGNFGYPLSRTGAGTKGNVAAELAETEISQSMGLTRLRGRLLYQAVQKAVEMIFARQAQFYTSPRHLPYIEGSQFKSVRWEPVADPNAYAVHVDPASFQIRSKTMLQRLYMFLAKINKIPNGRLYKMLEIPDDEKVDQEMTAQLTLQAMAAMKGKKA